MSSRSLIKRVYTATNYNTNCPIVTSSLVQYFDANKSIPTTAAWTDQQGFGNISFTNSPTITNTSGANNKYVTFNGTNQYGSGLTGMLNLADFTIYMWVKTTSTASNATFWQKPTFVGIATTGDASRDYGLTLNSGYLQGWHGLGSTDASITATTATINDGNWYEIAMTSSYTNGTKIFANQTQVGSAMTTSKNTDATNAPTIANTAVLGVAGYPAYLAFSCGVLMIYKKELTAKELAQNWANFKSRYGR